MRTATVRDLRNRYSEVLKWVEAGEDVAISRRGRIVARLIPEKPAAPGIVDWKASAAFALDKRAFKRLSAAEVAALIADSGGHW